MNTQYYTYEDYKTRFDEVFREEAQRNVIVCIGENENGKQMALTYAELASTIQRIGELLTKAGLKRADRIAVLLPHNAMAVMGALALGYLGYTAVMIDATLPVEECNRLIGYSEVSAIFTTEALYGSQEESVLEAIPAFKINNDFSCESFENSVKCVHTICAEPTAENVIAILFSSGTTGTMKGIKITYNSIMHARNCILQYANLDNKASYMDVLPINHIAGYSAVMSCVLTGVELGLLKEVNAKNMSEGFLEYNPTNFIMVPKIYEVIMNKILDTIKTRSMLVQSYAKFAMAFSGFIRKHTGIKLRFLTKPIWKSAFGKNLKLCGCGAAPCSKEIIEFYLNLGMDFLNVYGATETGFPISAANCNDKYPAEGAGNIHQFPEIDVVIDAPDAEGIGEIRVKSPLIMDGYYKEEELTRNAFDENGYFKTGDRGYIDTKGNLYIVGRIKESIVLKNGKKISPADVDDYYNAKVPGFDIASKGIVSPNGEYDEIHLFVVSDEEADLQRFKEASNLAPVMYKLSGIHGVSEIPKTSVGKVKRFCLEVPHEEEEFSIVRNIGDVKKTDELVYRCIEEILDIKNGTEISGEKRLFEDLGFDSLSYFELIVKLENLTGVDILGKQQKIGTVGELIELFAGQKEKRKESFDISKFPLPKERKHIVFLNRFKAFSKILWNFNVDGIANIPQEETIIFCPNHESYLDAMWVVSALIDCGFDISNFKCLAANHLLDKKLMKKAFVALGGIPVERTGNTVPAIERALQCLKDDKGYMLIHPEGTRTRSGKLGDFKQGAAKLATKANVKVVPVCINGAYEIFPHQNKLPHIFEWKHLRRYRLTIRFGTPIAPAQKTMDEITAEIRRQIVEMKK